MLEAVIFDIDGTLLDSVDLHAQAWVDTFAAHGHALPFEKVRKQIGKGGDQLMAVFLTDSEIATFGERLEADRGALFKQRLSSESAPVSRRPCADAAAHR
jgi:beta-phosphoglucomutase-like phosphatase (HAD superfamily)